MRATILADNIGMENLAGEWGLSIWIEAHGKKLLLDAGASGLFAENAEKLGISLKDEDCAVLSHAHYDHSYGMKTFFEQNNIAPFCFRETTAENCYAKFSIFKKYIGIPKGIIKEYADRIVTVTGDYRIAEGIWLIPHKTTGLEKVGIREHMYRRSGMRFLPDDFSHEQSLVIETEKGLVIFNSCSHGGADNIIEEVAATFPDKHVEAIIGGFHLFNKSEAEVNVFAERVKNTGINRVCTGHCTGKRAYKLLKEALGERVEQLSVGKVIVL